MKRFQGTLIAALVLVAVLGVWWVTRPAPPPLDAEPPALLRFEKEELVGFRLTRPDLTLDVRRRDGVWSVEGEPWRPARSMIRRVAHQLHDLDARAHVVDAPESPEAYGLGPDAVRVDLTLSDGRTLSFEVGDPNPTSVSWYLRPLPGDAVYVVKKSAVDFWRLDAASFREDRIAAFDAPDAMQLHATVDGRTLHFERTGERTWRMVEPVVQRADRDGVRRMLGRIAGLKAERFVADHPEALSTWGLERPRAKVRVVLADDRSIEVYAGDPVPDTDPPLRWIHLRSDDAVYAVRDGFLEAFEPTVEALRDKTLVGHHEWDVQGMRVTRGADEVVLGRTADGWRWADGEAVDGSTPTRVATRAAELEAERFLDTAVAPTAPWATVELTLEEGGPVEVRLGPEFPARWATVSGGRAHPSEVAVVSDALPEVIDDLFREHARKRARDAEKGLGLDEAGAEH